MSKGLYIHVPFCRRKCVYCDFYSLSGREGMIDAYVNAVIRNIKAYGGRYDTVYFGGGTPSLLSPEHIYSILSSADIEMGAEISAECNPDSVTAEKLSAYRRAGINRISVGIQSFDDSELGMLGRLHDGQQAKAALKAAAMAGFENISADLMLGLPYQKAATIENNIRSLAELCVTHISAYMLKIEYGTPLADNETLSRAAADSDAMADHYENAVSLMEGLGYHQYEISNFAPEGYECRHNLKYWRCEDYLGIGPSAHSCMDGKRFAVPSDIDSFMTAHVMHTEITDDEPCSEEERMMLALRLSEGYDLSSCKSAALLLKAAAPMEKHGLLTISENRIALTSKGFLVSNEIICRLAEALI